MPDPLNPRYSYGAGKLISEILAINFGRKFFERVLIFRPHNVYGPIWACEHVIPAIRAASARAGESCKPPAGCASRYRVLATETRSFCFIDDLVAGVMVMRDKGEHLGIYHVGTIGRSDDRGLGASCRAGGRARNRAGRRSAGGGRNATTMPRYFEASPIGL